MYIPPARTMRPTTRVPEPPVAPMILGSSAARESSAAASDETGADDSVMASDEALRHSQPWRCPSVRGGLVEEPDLS